MKRLIVLAIVVALTVAACVDYNFDGETDRFKLLGRVTEVGDQSVQIEIIRLDETSGRADSWFDPGPHRIHDNCDCHGTWHGRKRYGTVYGYDGVEIPISQVQVDQCLYIDGSVRDDNDGKYTSERPVFDSATLTPCG